MWAGNQGPRTLGELRPGPWRSVCNGTGSTLSRRTCRKVNRPALVADRPLELRAGAASKRDMKVSWTALYGRFGVGFKRLLALRTQSLECLEIALMDHLKGLVPPSGTGVTLRPSRPVVAILRTPPASKSWTTKSSSTRDGRPRPGTNGPRRWTLAAPPWRATRRGFRVRLRTARNRHHWPMQKTDAALDDLRHTVGSTRDRNSEKGPATWHAVGRTTWEDS